MFFCPCPHGLENELAEELQEIALRPNVKQFITFNVTHVLPGGVRLSGTHLAFWAINLYSRIANRVLLQLQHAPYHTEQDIYEVAHTTAWEQFFSTHHTFRIKLTAHRSPLISLSFATLRIKDAICDRFRQYCGDRPSINTAQPDIRIYAHLQEQDMTLYLDTSGEPLFKRGWRSEKGQAPIKENLAAGILRLIKWKTEQPLFDPMCGSGTFLIEAAYMAMDIPSGHMRTFAFEKMHGFNQKDWYSFRQQALDQVKTVTPLNIAGSDISSELVRLAQANWQRANLPDMISIKQIDASVIQPPFPIPGVMVLNPPYGERITIRGQKNNTVIQNKTKIEPAAQYLSLSTTGIHTQPEDIFASNFAKKLKQQFAGWQVYILSGDLKLPQRMRLKESQRIPLFNGMIECRLFRFQMVAGSARHKKNSQPSEKVG